MKSAVIVGIGRTPVGSFLGSLSSLPASQLGAHAMQAAMASARIEAKEVDSVIMGQVLPLGHGQAPSRQAALRAGLPRSSDVYSVNKVCSSGMKAIGLAANAVMMGEGEVLLAGGMESMSKVPFVLPSSSRQGGLRYGHQAVEDLVLKDGLWDPYHNMHMGRCAEKTASELGIDRESQDEYCLESYRRAKEAWGDGRMKMEVFPVKLPPAKKGGEGTLVTEDEEIHHLKVEKVSGLRPAFQEDGTITAANASKLNDGAACVVVMEEERAKKLSLTPLARILGHADFACEPVDFSLAPTGAVERLLRRTRVGKR